MTQTGKEPMDESRFWALIGSTVRVLDDGSVDAKPLVEALKRLPVAELNGFGWRCSEYHAASRTRELWGAAGLIHDGAPDDTFDYFRSWLIGRGRDIFEAAMKDADSLADVATPEALDDEVYCAADTALRAVHGGAPVYPRPSYPELAKDWDSSVDAIRRRYPRLFAKFVEGRS